MDTGSTCPHCGYHSEQILLTCPRCQQQMKHNHCNNCGRCPGAGKNKEKKNSK